jgi:hypothetical protein
MGRPSLVVRAEGRNVCPSSDNEVRDEIQDRMCGSGTADVSFATETASSLVRKLNVCTPSELPPPLTLFHLTELKISLGRSPPRAKTIRRR